MKIVTAAEMREIDRLTTEKYGVPSLTLMENAGSAVAEFAQKHFDFNAVCVVCGKGNNGGDGFVAARKLREAGKQVSVIVLAKSAEELRDDAAEMFKKLPVVPLWVSEEEHFENAEVQQAVRAELVVDAIVGTGFRPPIEGLGRIAIEQINNTDSSVVSVDLPSGAYSDSFLPAKAQGFICKSDGVITFTAPKPVHVFGETTRGPIVVTKIGSPDELVLETGTLDLEAVHPAYLNAVYAPREPDAHKGEFGHVLVIGGSVGKAGAPAMAAISALRSGAGLVTVACPRTVQPTVASFAPEIMTEPLPETDSGTLAMAGLERIEALAQKKDVLVLGPGLSRHAETDTLVRKLLPRVSGAKLVLDADGLNAFAGHPEELRSDGLLILTPHPGEMSRLVGISTDEIQNNRLKVAREASRKHNAIVVLKGHRTLIATPGGSVWVNLTGNPGMAKGGSGDVLSGIVAASLQQMQGGFFRRSSKKEGERAMELIRRRDQGDAMAAQELEERGRKSIFDMFGFITATAVCLHGLAGDVARDFRGEQSMLATDITGNIGEAITLAKDLLKHSKLIYLQR